MPSVTHHQRSSTPNSQPTAMSTREVTTASSRHQPASNTSAEGAASQAIAL